MRIVINKRREITPITDEFTIVLRLLKIIDRPMESFIWIQLMNYWKTHEQRDTE